MKNPCIYLRFHCNKFEMDYILDLYKNKNKCLQYNPSSSHKIIHYTHTLNKTIHVRMYKR